MDSDSIAMADPMVWHVCYLLQFLGYFTFFTWVVAFVVAILKRREVMGDPLLYTHATWQLRTIGYALLWVIVSMLLLWLGLLTLFLGIGFIFVAIGVGLGLGNICWMVYRVLYGWFKLYEHQPVPVRLS